MEKPPPGGNERLIEARGAGLRQNGRWLIEGLDLTIDRGEIVTLVGPNGSGKSTAARLITGVLKPSTGTITRRPGLKISYMPQKLTIDTTLPMTAERLMTLTGQQSSEDIDAALAATGVGHLRGVQVHHLSGGEFQRLLLARAIVRKPDLLVLDEPLQGVDFSGEVALYELISDIRTRTGCGILLISHDLHVVMAQTDSVICLNGHVCCRGTPESVMANPQYLKLFGHGAADTLAIYRHHHDHTHLPDGRIDHSHEGHGHSHDDAET